MDIKICKEKKKCSHFLIEKLVQELGELGNEDGLKKIKSKEEFKNWEKKIEKLGEAVKKFEGSVVEFFEAKGFYPCRDPMQICWGRRKYLTCLKGLDKKAYSKNIRSSPPFASLGYLKTKMEVKK